MIKRELGKNALLNGMKQVCAIIFPMISFVYCSRILGAEQLGKYSFGQSIVSYFLLISYLGIPTYAVREGSSYRKNKIELDHFINEIFSINCIMTVIAYFLLFGCLLFIEKLNVYKYVIVIQSIQLLLTTLGADWINTIYEDYLYLTIRYLVIQSICVVAMFLFVRNESNLYVYTIISVMANAGGNFLNFRYLRKKGVRIRLTQCMQVKKHVIPIMILFFNNIASVIYLNSDITMLGVFLDNTQVGVYTVSSRIYTIIKGIIVAIIMVTIPRFSLYISEKKIDVYKKELNEIVELLLLLVVPVSVGLFVQAEKIIVLIAGKAYLEGTIVVRILSIATLFAVLACFISYSVLIPNKKEKQFMTATIWGAIINVFLNLFFIPQYGIAGAAVTTLISEIVVCLIVYVYSIKVCRIDINFRNLIVVIIASAMICIICKLIDLLNMKWNVALLVSIVFSIIVYFLILFVGKHSILKPPIL